MKKLILMIVFLQALCAQSFSPQPPQHNYKDKVLFDAAYMIDKNISSSENVTMIFLEVQNNAEKPLRIEPNYNSYLKDKNRNYYYHKRVKSVNAFQDGFIKPGESRSGFVYFRKLKDENITFNFVVKDLKLYDRSKPFKLEWQFVPVKNRETAVIDLIKESAAVSGAATVINNQNLTYDNKLVVAQLDKPDLEKLDFKIDLPQKAERGQNIKLIVNAPTVADIKSITALIGISNYVDLSKGRDGVFTGYFRVPDVFDLGTYVVSFYIRFSDDSRVVRQKTLRIVGFGQ